MEIMSNLQAMAFTFPTFCIFQGAFFGKPPSLTASKKGATFRSRGLFLLAQRQVSLEQISKTWKMSFFQKNEGGLYGDKQDREACREFLRGLPDVALSGCDGEKEFMLSPRRRHVENPER